MFFRTLIYPTGKYHSSYGRFVAYSFASNVLLSTESVLSTHSMLSAIGIANTSAIITSNYVAKDIIGQLGGLFYMNKVGRTADSEPRKFLMYSHTFQQSAIFVECITPLIMFTYFLPIAGIANMAKNISFTGFGAINAKCIQTLAKDNNIGEIYSKITVLNTIGSSVGMLFGLGLIVLIPDHTSRLCLLPILGGLRIWLFQRAVQNLI